MGMLLFICINSFRELSWFIDLFESKFIEFAFWNYSLAIKICMTDWLIIKSRGFLMRLTKVRVAGCGPQIAGCGYAGHRLRAAGMRVAGHRLRAAGMRVAGHRLRAAGMRVAGHRLRAAGHKLRAAGHRLRAAGCRLQIAGWGYAGCGSQIAGYGPQVAGCGQSAGCGLSTLIPLYATKLWGGDLTLHWNSP